MLFWFKKKYLSKRYGVQWIFRQRLETWSIDSLLRIHKTGTMSGNQAAVAVEDFVFSSEDKPKKGTDQFLRFRMKLPFSV